MAGIAGFEPAKMPESKSGALPLGYIPSTLLFYHKQMGMSRCFWEKFGDRNVEVVINNIAFYSIKIYASLPRCHPERRKHHGVMFSQSNPTQGRARSGICDGMGVDLMPF